MDVIRRRVNEGRKVVHLTPPMVFLELQPTQAGNHISGTVHDRLLPFGDYDSQIAVTLETGALLVLDHATIESRLRCRFRHP